MKKFISFPLVLLLLTVSFALSAQQSNTPKDTYLYDKLVFSIPGAGAPQERDGYLIFTANSGPRTVGIAFDFENYRTIHPFQIRKTRNVQGKITQTLFFYVMERPRHLTQVSYRLIIDGLWTTDPLNPVRFYDESTGIELSKLSITTVIPPETITTPDDQVHFVYEGESGQDIRLTGSFTNWDSWIYELQETKPGFYELRLPLPPGKYYYNYVVGMTALVDTTNPKRAYTDDGRIASVITVR